MHERVHSQTGFGLTEAQRKKGLTLEEGVEETCPFYYRIDSIFGQQTNVDPICQTHQPCEDDWFPINDEPSKEEEEEEAGDSGDDVDSTDNLIDDLLSLEARPVTLLALGHPPTIAHSKRKVLRCSVKLPMTHVMQLKRSHPRTRLSVDEQEERRQIQQKPPLRSAQSVSR
ncbi:hypothetical protein DVH05_018222 [Phytophthora capsici]|nr:hypothetical protein DVH05_018222 [Phytophthora capsici]